MHRGGQSLRWEAEPGGVRPSSSWVGPPLEGLQSGPGSGSQVSTGVGHAAEPDLESGPTPSPLNKFAGEGIWLMRETVSLGFSLLRIY